MSEFNPRIINKTAFWLVKHKDGDLEWFPVDKAMLMLLLDECDFIPSHENVKPYESLQIAKELKAEIDRLKNPSRGVMTPELKRRLELEESGLSKDLKAFFIGRGNPSIRGNDLAVMVHWDFPSKYQDDVDSLKRRFRKLRELGYLISPEPNYYRYNPDLLREVSQ